MERVRAELARGDEDAELEVEERTVQRTEELRGTVIRPERRLCNRERDDFETPGADGTGARR